uniref:Chromosome 5 open reading frame 22 n=1 Tax=Astyanax mexicanus TaxID=7994 RepID=A0A8B9KX81_ASTMX
MKAAPVKRTYSKLPVWIVEDHHEVVPHIYRAIASRHLPLSGVKMVHLDSHPDLLISVNMSAKTVFDKEALFSELSIENWIMPMVFAGHVSHVAWLHPYWAQQIKEGEHYMCVGKDKSTGTIRVTSTDDYFLSDALYVPTDQLEDSKPLHLRVVNVDPVGTSHSSHTSQKEDQTAVKKPKINANNEADTQPSTCTLQPPDGSSTSGNSHSPDTQTQPAEGSAAHVVSGLLGLIEQNDAYILDIDLDFFSCKNPFKDLYTQEEYSILQELYSFKRPKEDADEGELSDCVERRTRQLEDLEAAFADLLEDDSQNTIDRWAANPGYMLLCALSDCILLSNRTVYPQASSHTGSFGNELHLSLTPTQCLLLVLFAHTLHTPLEVSIASSCLDEYCPAEQVDSIQSSMLEILETLFGSLDVHKDYESSTEESTSKSS